MQTQLNFSYRPQNSRDNQIILDDNLPKLNNQCRILLEALQTGKRLTVRDAMIDYGIGDFRARIRDLLEKGYDIKKQTLAGGFKIYWL